jgi:CHAT domain
MKILYIAANPDDQEDVDLGPEVTEIQRRVLLTPAVEFVVMPGLKFEDLPSVLHQQRPDILHIAAHGEKKNLFLASKDGGSVEVDAKMLLSFLNDISPPRLVYLNACNSGAIAKGLISSVPIAIGSTATIEVQAARAAAVSFYERILEGSPVARAFQVCKEMMRGVSQKGADIEIFHNEDVDPSKEVLHVGPRFIAEFTREEPRRDKEDCYEIRFGVVGCPPGTKQVVFFTDDPESITGSRTLENDLCSVVRDPPRGGLLWMEKKEAWDIDGDFRLYAVGAFGEGRAFTLSSMVGDALAERYSLPHGTTAPEHIAAAIADLRLTDGSRLLSIPVRRSRQGGKGREHSTSRRPRSHHSRPKRKGKK